MPRVAKKPGVGTARLAMPDTLNKPLFQLCDTVFCQGRERHDDLAGKHPLHALSIDLLRQVAFVEDNHHILPSDNIPEPFVFSIQLSAGIQHEKHEIRALDGKMAAPDGLFLNKIPWLQDTGGVNDLKRDALDIRRLDRKS